MTTFPGDDQDCAFFLYVTFWFKDGTARTLVSSLGSQDPFDVGVLEGGVQSALAQVRDQGLGADVVLGYFGVYCRTHGNRADPHGSLILADHVSGCENTLHLTLCAEGFEPASVTISIDGWEDYEDPLVLFAKSGDLLDFCQQYSSVVGDFFAVWGYWTLGVSSNGSFDVSSCFLDSESYGRVRALTEEGCEIHEIQLAVGLSVGESLLDLALKSSEEGCAVLLAKRWFGW